MAPVSCNWTTVYDTTGTWGLNWYSDHTSPISGLYGLACVAPSPSRPRPYHLITNDTLELREIMEAEREIRHLAIQNHQHRDTVWKLLRMRAEGSAFYCYNSILVIYLPSASRITVLVRLSSEPADYAIRVSSTSQLQNLQGYSILRYPAKRLPRYGEPMVLPEPASPSDVCVLPDGSTKPSCTTLEGQFIPPYPAQPPVSASKHHPGRADFTFRLSAGTRPSDTEPHVPEFFLNEKPWQLFRASMIPLLFMSTNETLEKPIISQLPIGSVVDLIMENQINDTIPLYKHGDPAWLLGSGSREMFPQNTVEDDLRSSGGFCGPLNLDDPSLVTVHDLPPLGWSVLRFQVTSKAATILHSTKLRYFCAGNQTHSPPSETDVIRLTEEVNRDGSRLHQASWKPFGTRIFKFLVINDGTLQTLSAAATQDNISPVKESVGSNGAQLFFSYAESKWLHHTSQQCFNPEDETRFHRLFLKLICEDAAGLHFPWGQDIDLDKAALRPGHNHHLCLLYHLLGDVKGPVCVDLIQTFQQTPESRWKGYVCHGNRLNDVLWRFINLRVFDTEGMDTLLRLGSSPYEQYRDEPLKGASPLQLAINQMFKPMSYEIDVVRFLVDAGANAKGPPMTTPSGLGVKPPILLASDGN
ncbi:hypothetical protein ACJZ2D_011542 [Fusarium nematophilum]